MNITTEDLDRFLAYVEANKERIDDFNVIQVQIVLGSFANFIKNPPAPTPKETQND